MPAPFFEFRDIATAAPSGCLRPLGPALPGNRAHVDTRAESQDSNLKIFCCRNLGVYMCVTLKRGKANAKRCETCESHTLVIVSGRGISACNSLMLFGVAVPEARNG